MRKNILLILIFTMFLCSCDVNNMEDNTIEPIYRKISAEEAREIMESSDDYILLDVRTEEEYREKRIDGAILIPDYEMTDRAVSELPDKNAVILIYCRSGQRSANAAKKLVQIGYTNIYDFGGIIDWPYETTSDRGMPTP